MKERASLPMRAGCASAILLFTLGAAATVLSSGSFAGQTAPSDLPACAPGTCCESYDSRSEDKNLALASPAQGEPRCDTPASRRQIPLDTRPCEHPEYWPYAIASERHPVLVHYRQPDERATALAVVKYVDTAWAFEVGTLGFSPPLPDQGYCGPSAAFDVFLWRGRESCWVDEIAGSPSSPWGGRMSYMAVDPWGRNGKDILRVTIGHEFNHASQAAENWNVPQSVMEMTATYVEQYFGDALLYNIRDLQDHPEHAVLWLDLDRSGNMQTYHMYGAGLYFYYLRDRFFASDMGFLSRFWKGTRNRNHPAADTATIVDALDALLAPSGSSFLQSAQEFARWRYYAGDRDDGRHFRPWPVPFDQLPFLSASRVKTDGEVLISDGDASYTVKHPPMLLGSAYVEVVATKPGADSFEVSIASPPVPGATWFVQAVPGLGQESDGDIVDLRNGPQRVHVTSSKGGGRRTLIFTLIPDGLRYDPAVPDTPDVFPYHTTHPLELRFSP